MGEKKVIKEFSDEDFYQDEFYENSDESYEKTKKDLMDTIDKIVGEVNETPEQDNKSMEVSSLNVEDLKDYVENAKVGEEESQRNSDKEETPSNDDEKVEIKEEPKGKKKKGKEKEEKAPPSEESDEPTQEDAISEKDGSEEKFEAKEELEKEEVPEVEETEDSVKEEADLEDNHPVEENEVVSEKVIESTEDNHLISNQSTVESPTKESAFGKIKKTCKKVHQTIYHKLFGDGYVEFTQLLIVDIIFFVCLILFGGLLLSVSFSVDNAKVISYQESSNLDYKIYLLPNEFYEEEYLGKDMIYVASLIDHIDIDYNYQFASSTDVNMDFSYKILADLEITNKEGTRSFFKKQYTLLEEQTLNMKKNHQQRISEQVKIDYSHYNSLANKFKASYGLDTDSKLVVYMVVTKKNPTGSTYTLNEAKDTTVTIPLSQKAVDIQVPYSEINNSNILLQNGQSIIRNYFTFLLSLLFFIFAIYFLLMIIKKMMLIGPKRSAYDAYVNKLLKEYDRLIAETDSLPSFDGKSIIKLRKFTELLDVHDNLQLPIIYYTITKHHKCYFYISHKDSVYLYILKAVDLEADQNEKKN